MPRLITPPEIALYRNATGCPVAVAVSTLEGMPLQLRSRVLAAARVQTSPLRDPVEEDAALSSQFLTAAAEAETLLRERRLSGQRGACHTLWAEQKRILRERFGIDWYTPAEMNPHVAFD